MPARFLDDRLRWVLPVALGLACQAVEPADPDPEHELRLDVDEWVEGATARAYDIEYDVVKGQVLSLRERAVDAEAYAVAADAAEEFFGSTEHTELPWTQMRVDYEIDGVSRTTIASLVTSTVAEDFLADVSKGYGAVDEPARVVRFSLQAERMLSLADTIAVALDAPQAFGTRTHHLEFASEAYVIDDSDIGQTMAPLRRADGGVVGAPNECGLREVFQGYNIVDDENRIDLVFVGVQDTTPFRIEDYLVGMLDLHDERAVMQMRDDGGVPAERRGVFGLDPFAGNHHLFNFWFRADPLQLSDIIDDPGAPFCTDKLDDAVSECFDGARELRIYMGSELDCRGTRSGDRVVIDVDAEDPYLRVGTLAHELGHMVFDLADEYTERKLGDRPTFPNCLDDGEEDRAADLGYPDMHYGCSYEAHNIRPSKASIMRDASVVSFDELNERWGCTVLASGSGYPMRGICSGSQLGFPSNYREPACSTDAECSSGVCGVVPGPGGNRHCVAGHLSEEHRCEQNSQCLSGLCARGRAGYDICYATARPSGEICRYQEQCLAGLVCGAISNGFGVCMPPQGAGQVCSMDFECASGICSSLGGGIKKCQDAHKEARRQCYAHRECDSNQCIYDGRMCTQASCVQEPPSTPRFCMGSDLLPGERCFASTECRGYDPNTGLDCHDFSSGSCIQRCLYAQAGEGQARELECMDWGQGSWDDCDWTYQCPADHTCVPSAGPEDDEALRHRCVPA